MPKGIPRKKNVSPTVLTIKELKYRRIPCAVVEKWIKTPMGGFRKDCFGFDIICLLGDATLGVQAGAGHHHQEKIRHAISLPEVKQWLMSPYRKFHVWTFSQRVVFNKTGAKRKKPKWTPRVTEIYLEDGEVLARPFELA
ncbi:MAG: hypothetical protein WC069_06775 [Candidatus Shapirobacteria bacterium]